MLSAAKHLVRHARQTLRCTRACYNEWGDTEAAAARAYTRAIIMDMFTPQCSSDEASKKAATRLYERNKVKSVEKVLQKCRTV